MPQKLLPQKHLPQQHLPRKTQPNQPKGSGCDLLKQLAAYSVAAAGAVMLAEDASAAPIPINLPGGPVVIGDSGTEIFNLDIDGDGNGDFRLLSDYLGELDIFGLLRFNGIFTDSLGFGTGFVPLVAGEFIDEYLGSIGSGFSSFRKLDAFFGTRGFMGARFDIPGGSPHFAYLDVSVDATGEVLTLYGGAYENQANTGILAGAIPEPSSLGLLALGAVGLATWHHRSANDS